MVSPGEILINVKGLEVTYGVKTILKNVDFQLHRNRIVTIIGVNGSGKSTLLKSVLGIIKPKSGSVEISPGAKIGYIPQKMHFDTKLPISIGRFMTLNQRASKEKQLEALDIVGISHGLDKMMNSLSGGEIQRVFLARVLVLRPDILVLDEPIQGVDIKGQIYMYKLIGKIRDDLGCGILLVSHDIHLVMKQTDYVLCLNGHICCQGLPSIIEKDSRFLEIIGEEVPDEKISDIFAIYSHRHDHNHTQPKTTDP